MISTRETSRVSVDIVRRSRLYEEVASRIEAQILAGDYRSGDALPSERELMTRYGVGRPAVREALLVLNKSGLVSVIQGGRARVATPNSETLVATLSGAARHLMSEPNGIQHFQDARCFLERGLARYAAEYATVSDLDSLRKALEVNRDARGDIAAFERTDVEFHHAIVQISRNPIFEALHQAMVTWLTEQRHITLQAPRQHELALRAHEQIYLAIKDRDADRAERMMRDHLRHVSKVYWKQLESVGERLRGDSRVPRKPQRAG
jgi:GntR family transcriptional repressor for pyruvate dehydrogenase complex